MKSKIHELNNFKNEVVSKTFKKLGKILFGALIVIAGFASCEKSDFKPEGPVSKMEESSPIVEVATWRIASFQWHNKENNDHFKDYVFRFNTDKSITAIHHSTEAYGKWDKRGNFMKIQFMTHPLTELNNSWTIVSHTRNSLVLKGLNYYDHSSELVEFERVNLSYAN